MTNTEAKPNRPRFWERQKLRGRLLTIMLAVALAAVLVCIGSFAFTLSLMLSGSRNDARVLSDNVHGMIRMLIYQQETGILSNYSFTAGISVDDKLAELRKTGASLDWDRITRETYDLIESWADIAIDGTAMFILMDDEVYVYGMDKESFIETAEGLCSEIYDDGEYEITTTMNLIRDTLCNSIYSKEPGGNLLSWTNFDEERGRIGFLTPNNDAMFVSEMLRELMETETGAAVDHMAATAWRSMLIIVAVIAALLIALPFASRRLALVVVNPVEREQERQRDLLRIAEEEKAMLERLDRLKTEFLGNVSHELKTPLTVMSSYAQYSQKTLADMPEMAEVENRMKLITSEADRLALMVTQILDVTRIEEGRMMLDPRPATLSAIMQRTINTYYPVFAKNNNRLRLKQGVDIPSVLCDEARISQVLVNLISNAARHTRDGEIAISAEMTDGFAAVTVSDTGEGIAAERLSSLFDRFKSHVGEKAPAGRETGTGLGLYICKHIIDSHGGEITVHSVGGEGTTVRFTLPLER